jgi:regulator of sirC expression with transglutaminase-like and TPR domain
VLDACERAVELEPAHGALRDSRGLAQALTDDYGGAIEDFQFYVEWGQGRRSQQTLDKRLYWIQELEAGRNPFDATTLEELLDE